jgi:KDO2-lipid IV(A) lauroyltransferase
LRRSAALLVARPFFAAAFVTVRILPRRAAAGVAAAASRAVYALFPGVRANLLANARSILGPDSSPPARSRLARETLASFARFIIEWVSPDPPPGVESLFRDLDGKEHFSAAAARGRGVLALTLHMGNYEIPARELAALRGDVAILFDRERIGFLEAIRSRSRRRSTLEEISFGGSRFFPVEVLERLRRGGVVLLAADQVDPIDGAAFPFLHGVARLSVWPARLAIASGAPILPVFCLRSADGTYRLRLEPPIFPRDGCEPEEITAEIIPILERYLREHAGQWLMVHRFWTEPEAGGRR